MEVKRATCVAPATCVALPGGVTTGVLWGSLGEGFASTSYVIAAMGIKKPLAYNHCNED